MSNDIPSSAQHGGKLALLHGNPPCTFCGMPERQHGNHDLQADAVDGLLGCPETRWGERSQCLDCGKTILTPMLRCTACVRYER